MNTNISFKHLLLSFTKSQRIGLLCFFLIMFVVQSIYFLVDFTPIEINSNERSRWLSQQKTIDSLKENILNQKPKIYPFNPNYISDFKGYKLGMSVQEIDRLLSYRSLNKFVNSVDEFQLVTKVSDSLLLAISPYFKFPEWVKNKKNTISSFESKSFSKPKSIEVIDINESTKEDLMKVYGVGDKLSDRILEQKEKFGAFVSMDQLHDIWGLSPEVIEKLNISFTVKNKSRCKKINLNDASVKELSNFPFFRYQLAKEIVIYRTMNGSLNIEDLSKIKGFPIEKIKIIALYLDF